MEPPRSSPGADRVAATGGAGREVVTSRPAGLQVHALGGARGGRVGQAQHARGHRGPARGGGDEQRGHGEDQAGARQRRRRPGRAARRRPAGPAARRPRRPPSHGGPGDDGRAQRERQQDRAPDRQQHQQDEQGRRAPPAAAARSLSREPPRPRAGPGGRRRPLEQVDHGGERVGVLAVQRGAEPLADRLPGDAEGAGGLGLGGPAADQRDGLAGLVAPAQRHRQGEREDGVGVGHGARRLRRGGPWASRQAWWWRSLAASTASRAAVKAARGPRGWRTAAGSSTGPTPMPTDQRPSASEGLQRGDGLGGVGGDALQLVAGRALEAAQRLRRDPASRARPGPTRSEPAPAAPLVGRQHDHGRKARGWPGHDGGRAGPGAVGRAEGGTRTRTPRGTGT